MRLTIERMRTLVLAAGLLLMAALITFLAIGKWKNPFNRKDLPQRLGIEIRQESNGVTYTQAHGGHTLFKLHASKVVQLKQGNALLHDVMIELYGADGSRVDRIEGAEFEYDQKAGTAIAKGQVEITLMRPGVAPAIAPNATPAKVLGAQAKSKPMESAAKTVDSDSIKIRTSGLTFDQKSGTATTAQRVDFTLAQGAGSSMGATYDSQNGVLVLVSAVELNTMHGSEQIALRAQHAEFDRDTQQCHLHAANSAYKNGEMTAGDATVLFRDDGSAERLNAVHGYALTTATGGHLAAPAGTMTFNEQNQPQHGHMEGGVTMDSDSDGRKVHGTSPEMELEFTAKGVLRRAHLQRGVEMHSEEAAESKTGPLHITRNWRSPIADVEFAQNKSGQVQPARIHGSGGVVVTSDSQQKGGPVLPSRMSADDLTAEFASGATLSAMTGVGHASIDETTLAGVRQGTSGDRLEVHMTPAKTAPQATGKTGAKTGVDAADAAQVQSANVDGHVVITQQPAPKPGAQAEAPLRATGGHAVYEGAGEWVHLTINPRIEDGGLQMVADRVDISQASGDAFAHGNVKATWQDDGKSKPGVGAKSNAAGATGAGFGGQGPAHVVAAEAQLHQSSGEATFRGQARLWQEANSVSGPMIVLDRNRQKLTAHSASAAEPVRVVLVSAGGALSGSKFGAMPDAGPSKDSKAKPNAPSVVRMQGGDLVYSQAERKAVMRGNALGAVVSEMSAVKSVSSEVELVLLPPGNHAGKDGATAQVDRMTARGHVVLTSADRRGTGEQLVYTSETEEYVLTGTVAAPPRMSDPARGTVTGEALIFHSRDDSVSVEGGTGKTTTQTSAPK